MKHRLRILLAAVLLHLALFPSPAVAESAKVRQGVKQVEARQYKKALKSFRDAVRKDPNDAEAMTRIGDLHASGQGVPRSDAEAAKWYAKAAPLGNAAARFALAARYASGRGVVKDPEAAVKWCRLAADQGHPGAQSLLGFLYEQGVGVPRDEAESLAWYRKAAGGGGVAAQKLLAWRHVEGKGVPK
ncbi:MAG: tetratricopeptide repeat protein, partial [bacterium]|nr:tetratricopeptide repeat protein [bacterium]